MAKTINTLTAFPFPPFCGTKSLHPRLRLRKSFFGWNWLLCGPAFSHPSLVQSPLSVQHVKTVQWPKHSTHPLHLPSFFCGTKSLHYRLRLRKRFFGWNWSALSQPSLVQSPLSDQRILKQSRGQNVQYTHFKSFFCQAKSLHHRLRLRERFVGWNWPSWG